MSVCAPCKAGGLALGQGFAPEVVMDFHNRCRGGTWCDCQHKLEGVNWLAVLGTTQDRAIAGR